jgi:hypothetical protein
VKSISSEAVQIACNGIIVTKHNLKSCLNANQVYHYTLQVEVKFLLLFWKMNGFTARTLFRRFSSGKYWEIIFN